MPKDSPETFPCQIIGFESQKHKEAEETRRQANENRKQDLHRWAVMLAEAKVDHQQVLTLDASLARDIAVAKGETPNQAQKAA